MAGQKTLARRRCTRERIARSATRTRHRSPQDPIPLNGEPVIRRNLPFFACILIALIFVLPDAAQIRVAWTKPFPPFRIAGNLYYVGTEDLAAYLIVTPKGNILINSNLQSSPPLIKKSVESLGFKFSDTKILLISHGHYDHCAGSAEIKRMTGAQYEVMAQDVPVVEAGGRNDFHYAADKTMWFPRTKVDRILHDGDSVSLGGST